MASFSHIVVFFAIFALVQLSKTTMATEYVVGDSSGWTTNFDYGAWAKDKVFYVGDKLVFKYPEGVHNVFKVNGTSFATCTVPAWSEGLYSGNDVVTLMTPGKKWYICGVANHCAALNQKLVINVEVNWPLRGWAPAPAPTYVKWLLRGWAPAPAPTYATEYGY